MKNASVIFAFLITLCNTYIVYATPTLETYGRLEQVSDVRISPNGELIAYRRTESDDKDFLVIYSLKKKKALTVVPIKDTNVNRHYFANNDFLILIKTNHLDLRGYTDSFDASEALSFDIKSKKIEPLIKLGQRISGEKTITTGQSGLGSVAGKSADGEVLFMPAFVSESRFDRVPKRSLLAVNLNGKGKLKTIDKGTRHTRRYFMDDRGNVVAREILNNDSNVHGIEVFEKNKWRKLYSYQSALKTHSFVGLSKDFRDLVFSRDDDEGRYLQLSLKSGEVNAFEGVKIVKDTEALIKNEHGVVLGFRYGGLMPDYLLTDPKLQKRFDAIVSEYEGHSVYLVDWTPDWKHIVVRIEGTLSAGDYFLFSEGKAPSFLVSSRLDIEQEDLNPIATTRYKARDGLMIPTILTLPKSKMDNLKRLPTVLMPHGGPASHDQIGFDFMAQAFASRGYLVIQPQFRGSTGFGVKHYEAGLGEWGKGMQHDLDDAVNTFVENGYIDPERICIVGASYGGYASLAAAAFTPDQFKCAVSIAGVSHLPKMLASTRKSYGRSSWVLDYWNRSILDGDFDNEALKEISPYYSADKIAIPVLLVHGENDTTVDYEQSKLMLSAIKKVKGEARLVKLKNDDHYLQNGETRIQAVKETVEFVDKHIGR